MKPRAILVLGMHCCGTGALTRCLGLLGAELGSSFIAPAADNPAGFWEDVRFVSLNQRLTQLLGEEWNRWWEHLIPPESPLSPCDVHSLVAEVVEEIEERFASCPLWAVNDPRTLRILPFWEEVLRRARVETDMVLVVCHPLACTQPLEQRYGIPEARSLLLWTGQYLGHWPRLAARPFQAVDYDRLLEDPDRELRRLSARLGLPWSEAAKEEVRKFLKPDLRHARCTINDLRNRPNVLPIVVETLEALEDLCVDREPSAVSARMEALHAEFRRMVPLLRALDAQAGFARRAEQESVALRGLVEARERELAELREERARSRTWRWVERLRGCERSFRRWSRTVVKTECIPGVKTHARDTIDSLDYEEWMSTLEPFSLPNEDEVAAMLQQMGGKAPKISLVVPVWETPEKHLRECIEAVRHQSYPHWELCLADDCSTQPHVKNVLKEYAAEDARIKITFREEKGHISRASNTALELAAGDYVAFLGHADLLSQHALYFMAQVVVKHRGAKIVYSDEDKIDEQGRRFEPHFKSDWNPDLLYSINYARHLSVYQHDLIKTIGGFRVGVEGSQDYDLLLRCLPHVKPKEIVHIARILYHERATDGSSALATNEESCTGQAGMIALQDYFTECGPSGVTVETGMMPNSYRIRWPIPLPAPLVSLLIPTRDKRELIEVAVRSILEKSAYRNYEILIIDNGSVEAQTIEWFAEILRWDSRVRVLVYDQAFNFSAMNNLGVRHARGSIVCLINNDVEVINADWLGEMVSQVCRPDIGCVGAKLYYRDGTIQHGGVRLSRCGLAGHLHKHYRGNAAGYGGRLKVVQNCSGVTGACLVVRRSVYEEVGGLDERLKVAFNDVDFCLRVRRAGYRNLWTPYAELYHYESVSRGYDDTPEKQRRVREEMGFMKARWGSLLEEDPYYNTNLENFREELSLKRHV